MMQAPTRNNLCAGAAQSSSRALPTLAGGSTIFAGALLAGQFSRTGNHIDQLVGTDGFRFVTPM
jgi:hypothetical protein